MSNLLKAEVTRVDDKSVTLRLPVQSLPITISLITLELALERETVLPVRD